MTTHILATHMPRRGYRACPCHAPIQSQSSNGGDVEGFPRATASYAPTVRGRPLSEMWTRSTVAWHLRAVLDSDAAPCATRCVRESLRHVPQRHRARRARRARERERDRGARGRVRHHLPRGRAAVFRLGGLSRALEGRGRGLPSWVRSVSRAMAAHAGPASSSTPRSGQRRGVDARGDTLGRHENTELFYSLEDPSYKRDDVPSGSVPTPCCSCNT